MAGYIECPKCGVLYRGEHTCPKGEVATTTSNPQRKCSRCGGPLADGVITDESGEKYVWKKGRIGSLWVLYCTKCRTVDSFFVGA